MPAFDESRTVNRVLKALGNRDSFTALVYSRHLANSKIAEKDPLILKKVFMLDDIEYLYVCVESAIRNGKYAYAVSYLVEIRRLDKLACGIS